MFPSAVSLGFAFPDLWHELFVTRRVLRRVPDEHWSWRPHPKSRTMGALATHVVEVVGLGGIILSRDAHDVAAERWPDGAPQSRDGLLAAYERAAIAITQGIGALPEPEWNRVFTVRRGGTTLLGMPRNAVFRSMFINHLVHHRAHLAGYLRHFDISIVALYGPTADEDGPPM
jgi:uncharacterized damage-inducible protein DinB